MRKRFNKKGEEGTPSGFTIAWVLTAIAAGFLLAIFFMIDLDTDDEICTFSVLTRATTADSVQGTVPLKCKTKKTCIGGKDCDQFAGEDFDSVRLSGSERDRLEDVERIEREIVNGKFNCRELMQDGKLDIFGRWSTELNLRSVEPTCVICHRFALDEDVAGDIWAEVDINNYMATRKPSGSDLTYAEVFTHRGVSAFPRVDESSLEEYFEIEDGGKIGEQNGREVAVVFSQIKTTSFKDSSKNLADAGMVIGVGAFLTPGVNKLASKVVFSGPGLAALATGAVAVTGVSAWNSYEGKTSAAGYCGDLVSNDEKAKQGCSVFQVVPYDVDYINELCTGGIQGIA